MVAYKGPSRFSGLLRCFKQRRSYLHVLDQVVKWPQHRTFFTRRRPIEAIHNRPSITGHKYGTGNVGYPKPVRCSASREDLHVLEHSIIWVSIWVPCLDATKSKPTTRGSVLFRKIRTRLFWDRCKALVVKPTRVPFSIETRSTRRRRRLWTNRRPW